MAIARFKTEQNFLSQPENPEKTSEINIGILIGHDSAGFDGPELPERKSNSETPNRG